MLSVPTRLPMVENAYRRPARAPAPWCAMESIPIRNAHGAAVPRGSTGTAISTSVATSDATNAPAAMLSRARTPESSAGLAAIGRSAMHAAAAIITVHNIPVSGQRSASRPPHQ